MILTKKKAVEIAIELWTYLAEIGEPFKCGWPDWEKYGKMNAGCPFCEYAERAWIRLPLRKRMEGICGLCPYKQKFVDYCTVGPYDKWENAKTTTDRKKYAAQFLQELKELRNGKNENPKI